MLFRPFIYAVAFASLFSFSACNDDNKSSESPKTLGNEVANTVPIENKNTENEKLLAKNLFKAKARLVVGNVKRGKESESNSWRQLRVGMKVVEGDLISTAVESEAVLAIDDGSTLKIVEQSNVKLTAENVNQAKGAETKVSVLIAKGNVIFDIQKQKNQTIEFRTGIAVAAIRGTAGFVGNANGQMVASLKEGRVEVATEGGKTAEVLKNQTVIVNKKGIAKKLNLASSGTKSLTAVIDSIVAVDTNEVSQEQLENALRKFDKGYAARQKSFEKNLKFNGLAIAPSIYESSVVLVAQATPGILVTVMGEVDKVPENGFYQKTVQWDSLAYGTKRFLASCSDGDVEVPCFMWVTEYVDKANAPAEEKPGDEQQKTVEKKIVEEKHSEAPAKSLNLSVKLGNRSERIHLDLPATEYSTNLLINLAGIGADDLDQVKSITVLRGGKTIETIGESNLTSLTYEVPVKIERNKIAEFEVVVALKNGKNVKARKTYEVYCLVSNHPGGKARNSVLPQEQEYERLVQNGGLTHE